MKPDFERWLPLIQQLLGGSPCGSQNRPYLLKLGEKAIQAPGHPYAWKNEIFCYNNRVVIPPSDVIKLLLHEYHGTLIGGHSGVLRTLKRLSQQFYWPKMHRSVRKFVATCDTCQRAKADTLSPAGLLQLLPIPSHV